MLKCGILAGTGMVGQKYISLLNNHPWFEVSFITGSDQSVGKTYAEAVENRWHMTSQIPKNVRNIRIESTDAINKASDMCDFVFSALDTNIAKIYETKYADSDIPVISNSSAHRWDSDVPMLIPEINSIHCDIIQRQRQKRGWKNGFIAVKPNCSVQSYLTPLFALHERFQVKKALITTMQAVSGAGYPGVSSIDITDNIVPFISGEEEKSELEPLKIFGTIQGDEIVNNNQMVFSAHCNRVNVQDGHLATVNVAFSQKPVFDDIIDLWNDFAGEPQKLKLPSAPDKPIIYKTESNRPQPRLDRDEDKGMACITGRLRKCNILDWKFVALSHNTVRGAAGGGILNAELLYKKKYLIE